MPISTAEQVERKDEITTLVGDVYVVVSKPRYAVEREHCYIATAHLFQGEETFDLLIQEDLKEIRRASAPLVDEGEVVIAIERDGEKIYPG